MVDSPTTLAPPSSDHDLVLAIADLTSAVRGDADTDRVLRSLCTVAVRALGVDGAAVFVRDAAPARLVHAAPPELEPLALLEELLQDGPGAVALEGRGPLPVGDLRGSGSWPELADLARDQGIGAVLAVPLVSSARTWGVLDLYRAQVGPWTPADVSAAAVLVAVAVSSLESARRSWPAASRRGGHDALTGLPDRGLLFDRLQQGLLAAHRRGSGVAVLLLDLDGFASINAVFGHAAGDRVLVEVARRLTGLLRSGDTLSRFAGDEFIAVCEGLADEGPTELLRRAQLLVGRLQQAISQPVPVGAVGLAVTVSVGVAVTQDLLNAHELIAEAESALATAKESGPGRVHVRDQSRKGSASRSRRRRRALAEALGRDELLVHYQPIVRASDHRPVAVEALLRWQQGDGSILAAQEFIELAVGTGLIAEIGRWVVDQTCAQLTRWQRELGADAPGTAFVNLSGRELSDDSLPSAVAASLAAHGLEPRQLGLEIVEDHLAHPEIVARLEHYSRLGHPLSIDDFGTGYSSISRLIDLPADFAKIDMSFVAGLPDDRRRARLVDGIVTMATNLDLQVIAEGVETAAQADYLTRAGCHLLQGYHLGRPAPGDAVLLGRPLAADDLR